MKICEHILGQPPDEMTIGVACILVVCLPVMLVGGLVGMALEAICGEEGEPT